ncbi:MAG: hypothetical protein V1862_04150 [Methanobacteriota archaeon]
MFDECIDDAWISVLVTRIIRMRTRGITGICDHPETRVRVVITGKGGIGKTTITAFLSIFCQKRAIRWQWMKIPYAIDLPRNKEIIPITRNLNYLKEKTGTGWVLMMSPTRSSGSG